MRSPSSVAYLRFHTLQTLFSGAPLEGGLQQFDQTRTLHRLKFVEIVLPPANRGTIGDLTYLEQGPVRLATLEADEKFTVMIRHVSDQHLGHFMLRFHGIM
ncbi:hypothetical protein [Rhizobium rhizophilum]|uniref:Uncharacterized protein n=1 Tax=Rhizobium rhizophilum TaxID=1850373 RepID=A0ABY2QQX4_9HYPH|nr:hypothetical protein [Rhizobium rhizophilum]THV12417.1 hypothetical protein E9677_16705 [Rhizobium rhizophilum]